MDQSRARDLYYQYRAAVAYVAVRTPRGDEGIGTAFHVGDNIWVTARHVVEGNEILEVATTGWSIPNISDTLQANKGALDGDWLTDYGRYKVIGEPMLHPEAAVDVAALKLDGPFSPYSDEPSPEPPPTRPPRPSTPIFILGDHLDDWLGDEYTLERVLVMGYPPIPFGREPRLVATTAEVNAVHDRRDERHPYFILSAMARGGFSGAPALTSHEVGLGVATESLVMDNLPTPLGYFAVLSVEPIFNCLEEHGVFPKIQPVKQMFDELAPYGPPDDQGDDDTE